MLTPAAVGVPLIAPVEALIPSPAGKPVADHVYGVVPPVAASVAPGYAVLTTPDGNDDVVIESWPVIVIDRLFVAVRCVGFVESVTVMFTVLVAAAVAVPLMTPVDASMLSPVGRPVADHVYGVVPPVALTVALYGVPALPPGNEVVVMVGGAMIVIAKLTVAVRCVGFVESVTVMAAVLAPAVVGVPLITPVEALIPSPAGKPVADQV